MKFLFDHTSAVLVLVVFSVPIGAFITSAYGIPCNNLHLQPEEWCINPAEAIQCPNDQIDCLTAIAQVVFRVQRCGQGNSQTRCIVTTPPQDCTLTGLIHPRLN